MLAEKCRFLCSGGRKCVGAAMSLKGRGGREVRYRAASVLIRDGYRKCVWVITPKRKGDTLAPLLHGNDVALGEYHSRQHLLLGFGTDRLGSRSVSVHRVPSCFCLPPPSPRAPRACCIASLVLSRVTHLPQHHRTTIPYQKTDYTNGGAQVNPAMSVGTYFYGWNDQSSLVSILPSIDRFLVVVPIEVCTTNSLFASRPPPPLCLLHHPCRLGRAY